MPHVVIPRSAATSNPRRGDAVHARAVQDSSASPRNDKIDWDTPWLETLRPLRVLLDAVDWREALTREACRRALVTGAGKPLTFVDPAAAGATPYESFIATTGQVPTRDNAHDRFNALTWLSWPRAKAALNARQAAAIARDGVKATRGPVRDAATLIDENAVVLRCADPAVARALAAHDWQTLLVSQRARWGRDITVSAFGHALLEKLLQPFKGITASVVVLDTDGDADAALARFVARADLAPALLGHLPVLGIPGWCSANRDPAFYDDATVFRPARSVHTSGLVHRTTAP